MEVLGEKLSRVTMNPTSVTTAQQTTTTNARPSTIIHGYPLSLPMKLHAILDGSDDWVVIYKDESSITSTDSYESLLNPLEWDAEGQSFRILDLPCLLKLLSEIVHKQSDSTALVLWNEESFRSQLDTYGFKQVLTVASPGQSASEQYRQYEVYKHPMFIKGRPDLAASIKPATTRYYGSANQSSSSLASSCYTEDGAADGVISSPHRMHTSSAPAATTSQASPFGSPRSANAKSGSTTARSQFNSPVYKKDKIRRSNPDGAAAGALLSPSLRDSLSNSENHNQNQIPESELADPGTDSKSSKRRFPCFSDLSMLSMTPTKKVHASLLENLYDPHAAANTHTHHHHQPHSQPHPLPLPQTYIRTQNDRHSFPSSADRSGGTARTDASDEDPHHQQHHQQHHHHSFAFEPIQRTYGRDEYQTSLRSSPRGGLAGGMFRNQQSVNQSRRIPPHNLYIATNQNISESVSLFDTAPDESCKSFVSYRSGCTDSSENVLPEHHRPLVPEADWGPPVDEWAYYSQRFDGSCVSSPQLSVAHHSASSSEFMSPSQRLLRSSGGSRGGSAQKFLFPLSEEDDFNCAAKSLISTPNSAAVARWGRHSDSRSHGHGRESRIVGSVNSSAEKPLAPDHGHWFGNRKQFHELALLMIPKPQAARADTDALNVSYPNSARAALDAVGLADVLRQPSDELSEDAWGEITVATQPSAMLPPRAVSHTSDSASPTSAGATPKSAANFNLRTSTLTEDSDEEM